MIKLKTIFLFVATVLLCLVMVCAFAACDDPKTVDPGKDPDITKPVDPDDPAPAKEVSKIEVATEPTATEVFVGGKFSAAGGKIKVFYSDGTSEIIEMTAAGLELTSVKTDKPGMKTITVKYCGKKASFKIFVIERGYDVTFDYNYEGSESTTKNIIMGNAVAIPAVPVREAYDFYAWYMDKDCTIAYDFDSAVLNDLTLYAMWKEKDADYFEVTYDLGYYGCAPQTYKQIVKSGEKTRVPDLAPSRSEYAFDGWFVGENALDTEAAITADTTVTAKWTKTKTRLSTYVFEAEETDLTGKSGPGYSGNGYDKGMIVPDDGGVKGASGSFVSFLYRFGNSLEFHIAADAACEAQLSVFMAAEIPNANLTYETYQIKVNDSAQRYADVSLPEHGKFTEAVKITVSLKKGYNIIRLVTNNSTHPDEGNGTYEATAPMIDCIKLTTDAVLIWDANYGLPMKY